MYKKIFVPAMDKIHSIYTDIQFAGLFSQSKSGLNKLKSFKFFSLIFFLLSGYSNIYSQTSHHNEEESKENTFIQTSNPWKPSIDVRSDVAIVYGAGETFKERIKTWQDRGYKTAYMTGIAWGGSYRDYFFGNWDGKKHLDEAQVTRQGDTIWHGRQTPYFFPTMNFLKYFKENHLKKAIDAGIDAIYLEEPEFFAQAGYSEAFKREWKDYYGFDWRSQFDSPENAYLSQKLKHYIFCRAIEESFAFAKEYGKSKGINVRCYVPTHSLLNYTVWEMISPELSLAFMPNVDGFQCQTWTGTAREPNYYNGKAKERVLETAYLEYGSMVPMASVSGRKLTFNIDPIEDRRRDWTDYKKNYEANFIAYLLYPTINNFEVMPWPNRIFEGTFPVSLNSDKREKIPGYYATQMMVMINACNYMPLSDNKLSGSRGISVLMSNSLMFQRWPTFDGYNDYPPVEAYEEPEIAQFSEYKLPEIVFGHPRLSFSNFYGQALPLLKRGVPVQIMHLESVSYPEAWKDTKVLIMSYSNMKPLSAEYHNYIADWVSKGGVLVYCGRDEDPYQNIPEWWNTGDNNFRAPSDHLFEKMNIKSPYQSGSYDYGDGLVYIIRQDPKDFVLQKNSDQDFVNTVKLLYDIVSEDEPLEFKNNFHLERGAYDIIAVVDENADESPYIQEGHLIDLFDHQLPVLSKKVVNPGQQALLFNIDRVENKKKPQVLVTAARIYDEKTGPDSYSFVAKSPINTVNAMRVLLPETPSECIIKNPTGKESGDSVWEWDPESKTCFVKFDNNPEGVQVRFSW